MNREKEVLRTSIVGIIVNALLSIVKIIIGISTNSISIVSDAMNNMGDVLSSVLTILGMKLSLKPADKEHPYGHGRIEYLSAGVVSIIIFVTGVQFFRASFDRILNPVEPSYSTTSLIVLVIAIITKILLGRYVKKKGEQVNSSSLKATGADATLDALMSLATLISAVVTITTDVIIDGYVGILLSVIVIRSAIELIKDTIDDILGKRVEGEIVESLIDFIMKSKSVISVNDVILNSYGPDKLIGSVNVELDDTLTVKEASKITRRLQRKVIDEYGILLVFGIYGVNTTDSEIKEIETKVRSVVMAKKHVVQVHAFCVEKDLKTMEFDVVVDLKEKDVEGFKKSIIEQIQEIYKDYTINVYIDKDYTGCTH